MPAISELHGQKADAEGNRLLIQDSRLATNSFGLDNYYYLTPKSKFLFFVNFIRIGARNNSRSSIIPNIAPDRTSGQDPANNLGFIVKSADRPKMSFETETCNQYNRKRIVQKRVEYKPVTIKFHDTVDNKLYKMFESYFQYYFGDSSAPSFPNDIISGSLLYNNWGFIGNTLAANLADYFSSIQVYQVYGGYYDRYDLINPKIVSFDPDDHDYGASGTTHEVGLSVAYEAVKFAVTAQPLASDPGLITMMGLDLSDFYEPEDGPIAPAPFTSGNGSYLSNDGGIFSNPLSTIANVVTNSVLDSRSLSIKGIFNGALTAVKNNAINSAYNLGNTGIASLAGQNPYVTPLLRGITNKL